MLNIIHADQIGCHIITMANDPFKKMDLFGKDLDKYSRDTVKMSYNDAKSVGHKLETIKKRVEN